jgi:hypothetical protein
MEILMNKRAAGISLIAIAACLYSVRYISAAIWGSTTTSWSIDLFDNLLNNVGTAPLYFSWISLAAGIVYLYQAEVEEKERKRKLASVDKQEEVNKQKDNDQDHI